jgi:hypothetical protein
VERVHALVALLELAARDALVLEAELLDDQTCSSFGRARKYPRTA